jgi:hypothetical protein
MVGSSVASPVLQFTTVNVPQSMTTVTCSDIEPTSITLSWTAVDTSLNGGDPINFYLVELAPSYTALNTNN